MYRAVLWGIQSSSQSWWVTAEQRVALSASGDCAMNNWFSALMAVAVFSVQVDIMLCLTQLPTQHSLHKEIGPIQHGCLLHAKPIFLARLAWITWGGAHESYVTCCVTLARDIWAEQTGQWRSRLDLELCQNCQYLRQAHTKYYVAHTLTVHCNDNIEANRMLITMLCWMNK